MGLEGAIRPGDFGKLLQAQTLNGQLLHARSLTTGKARAGIDLTFSAPKSVSIAAQIGGDERLIETHRIALIRTLTVLEKRGALTRVSQDGKRNKVCTENLAIGQFHHDTSRARDPQIHTHCVILNFTQAPDGRWQSLDNQQLYRLKMMMGLTYRNELAIEVQKLGYQIERREGGLWEIQGYCPEVLGHFSKRAKEIKAAVSEGATSKQKELAALKTRVPKGKEISREALKAYWQEQADRLQVQHPQSIHHPPQIEPAAVEAAVSDAIDHCLEREVSFNREDLEKFIFTSVGRYSFESVSAAIEKNSELIQFQDKKRIRYTTQAAVNREQRTVQLLVRGQGKENPIASPQVVANHLIDKPLTVEQRQAIEFAASSTDQVLAWQGCAGVGKSYTVNEFGQIAQAAGYRVMGFAPGAESAKVLETETGLPSTTAAAKLQTQPSLLKQRQFWIIDEAGLLSAKDAAALMERARFEDAKMLLIGDTRQLSAAGAGNPFKSLQQHGMATAHLEQSFRQKEPHLKYAVDLIVEGNISEGISLLEQQGRVQEIGDRPTKLAQIAQDYLSLTLEERSQTLVLTDTNQECQELTTQIRRGLQDAGLLGQDVEATRLKPRDLTEAQMRFCHHYQRGDVVILLADYKRFELVKGEAYAVTAIDPEHERLSLRSEDGSVCQVDPARIKKTVYERLPIAVAEGDHLRWTKNQHDLSRRKGQEFTVTSVQQNYTEIVYSSGSAETVDLRKAQHFDHAWVSTTYSSQGKASDRVLLSATKDCTVSRESIYVGVSRAKFELQIYVSDIQNFRAQSQIFRVNKNPLEPLSGNNHVRSS